MPIGNLTKNFSIEEFFVSSEFPEMAKACFVSVKKGNDYELMKAKAFYLARLFLQPIRDMYDEPVQILSGVRGFALNKAIGGAETSDHLYHDECAAADFTCRSIDSVANMLANSKWPFGQMIWYPEQRFIHISLPSRKHFKESLKKINGHFHPFFDSTLPTPVSA